MNNDLDRRVLLGAAGLAGMSALAAAGRGGPLNPPAGAVAPTGKTLGEIEPRTAVGPLTTPGDATALYVISQPGSYYLTGNVQGVVNKTGIRISASGVSLDLMGFDVRAAPSANGSPGVWAEAGQRNVQVSNGSVTGWSGGGVALIAQSAVARHIVATGCTYGLQLGAGAMAVDCSSSANAIGFSTGKGSVLTRCVAHANTSLGFNGNVGMHTECCAIANLGNGFQSAGMFRGCLAQENTGTGIVMIGVSSATACIASDNNLNGISGQQGSMVRDCVCYDNGLHGIDAPGFGIVAGNVCTSNGRLGTGHGIIANGGRNRIEGNHCVSNNRGIDMSPSTGNIAIHNTVSGNSTSGYVQGASNLFGPNVVPANNQINVGTNPHTNYEA